MKKHVWAALAVMAGLGAAGAFAQDAANTIDAHLRAAKTAAEFDYTGTLARTCVLPQTGPGRDVAPGPAPDRSTWYTEPAKVFDNLYFVGTKIHSSWALTTSDGIILIDTLYEYASDEAIVGGLKKLGLDPANVKYVIISHAHGDHVGGAKLMQDRFHSRIVMGAPDWDSIEQSKNQYPHGKPKRDIVAMDGQKITLGDTSVILVLTPGHTPGTVSMIFQVKDGGKPLTVAYSGGTAFNFVNDVPHFDIYINSQRKMAAAAANAGATIVMSNHSEFDNAVTKIKLIAARKPGEPHPFEVGREAVARYFKVMEECAQVARLKLVEAQTKKT
ncbi:MAG TPA: MBL fold metallo-hydrolase [Micropepsaceae bacterium]|jgi:metallo-beta-lactamase class B|nr:MBL fold metallo-hydrolase [Micropepsaceae bacterium]